MGHGRECFHCKQWVADGEAHDCWSTTEAALTRDLHEDLQDAYDRVRGAAVDLGEQRIYASHHSIMFSRRVCYCFVRPRHSWLDVCVFLGREVKGPLVRRATRVSKTRVAHLLRVTHRDEVEAPLTDWIAEAYELAGPAGAGFTRVREGPLAERTATDASARRPSRRISDASARRPSHHKRAAKKR